MTYAGKAHYEANKEKYIARAAAWERANPERARESARLSRARWRQQNPELAKAADRAPKARYSNHKAMAKIRGIPWEFTFETWWDKWEPFWLNRGRKAHNSVMSRYGDTGPYSPSNTRIISQSENALERERIKRGRFMQSEAYK